MKSKQLANVLIKILGLSICVHAITMLVAGALAAFNPLQSTRLDVAMMRIFSSAVASLAEVAIGVILIALSQKIAELMFRHDEE